ALPRTATPPARRVCASRVGHVGQQSPRALLHVDRRRPKTAFRRAGRIRADGWRNSGCTAIRLRIGSMRLIRRLAYLLRFTTHQSDLREEMELHRTLVADD